MINYSIKNNRRTMILALILIANSNKTVVHILNGQWSGFTFELLW